MLGGESIVRTIIPYQELSGSYNLNIAFRHVQKIIPYQELSGSYNPDIDYIVLDEIIPYQELSGSYNLYFVAFLLH